MNKDVTAKLKDSFMVNLGIVIVAAAIFFFQVPSHVAVSSISGLAIILNHFLPLSVATLTMIMNVVLLLVAYFFLSRNFAYKTAYATIVLPAIMLLFEKLFPNNQSLTGDVLLDVIAYIFFVSIGLAILFNRNTCSGGLDVVAKLMQKYLHMELGKALGLAGLFIAALSIFAFDKKTVILSILGTYFNGIILDHFIFGQSIKKRVCIITDKADLITDYILHRLHSGMSVYDIEGAYSHERKKEIVAVVDRQEYQKLMSFLEKEDSKAFITVYNVAEIHYTPKKW
ncbi:YitT family protein [Oribacterium parvum]|uniref:YitT family protein n=1 Tax=Oribacterium parvum TaxID=1501329 RepID=UPI0028EA96A9|nr:YitT family protein [Oribacterium parvum]